MWSGAPANTKQFALIYDDPDVAFGNPPQSFVHWVVYKIPGTAKGPACGAADGRGADGAAPTSPARSRACRASSAPAIAVPRRLRESRITTRGRSTRSTRNCRSSEGLNRNQLMEAMKGHIIGQGSLVAIYERKPKQ